MDYSSLSPEQKQAVICSHVIQNYAKAILDSSDLSENCSESEALIKIYAYFLILDNFIFQRSESIRYQCLAQLADEFDDYTTYSHRIGDTVNRYLASWKSRKICLTNEPTQVLKSSDLPILFSVISNDLSKSGYTLDDSILAQYASQYFDDFSADFDDKSIPTESSNDNLCLDELNHVFDELENNFPDYPLWDNLRKISIQNYQSNQSETILDELKTHPTQYAIESVIYICMAAILETPVFDSSGILNEIGKAFKNLAHDVGEYGVKQGYISSDKVSFLNKKLLQTINTASASSIKSTAASEDKTETEKYKDYKLSPLEDDLPCSGKEKTKKPYRFLIFAVALLIAVLGVLKVFSNSTAADIPTISSTSRTASSISAPYAIPSYTGVKPISKPKTGLFHGAHATGEVAPFKVTAAQNTDYYLLLCQNQKVTFGYYIHAGETLSTEVPLGSYNLYYACAPSSASWYGESNLWGTSTDFYKSDEPWDFIIEDGYYTGYTLTLSVSGAGNTRSYDSTRSAWDELFE